MAFNFQAGCFVPVSWQPLGGALTTLNIKDHSLDISVLLYDVTGTANGGLRGRLAGTMDIAGTVNADFDLDAPPYGPVPSIFPGSRGIAIFGVSVAKGIQCPVSVEKIHWSSGIEQEVKYSFDVKANSLVGLLVYPSLS